MIEHPSNSHDLQVICTIEKSHYCCCSPNAFRRQVMANLPMGTDKTLAMPMGKRRICSTCKYNIQCNVEPFRQFKTYPVF